MFYVDVAFASKLIHFLSLCKLCNTNAVLTEVESDVVCTHENITQNPQRSLKCWDIHSHKSRNAKWGGSGWLYKKHTKSNFFNGGHGGTCKFFRQKLGRRCYHYWNNYNKGRLFEKNRSNRPIGWNIASFTREISGSIRDDRAPQLIC